MIRQSFEKSASLNLDVVHFDLQRLQASLLQYLMSPFLFKDFGRSVSPCGQMTRFRPASLTKYPSCALAIICSNVIWFDSVESKGDHVKTVGEGVNQPHRAVRGDILVQTLREKHRLLPVCPSLKSHVSEHLCGKYHLDVLLNAGFNKTIIK